MCIRDSQRSANPEDEKSTRNNSNNKNNKNNNSRAAAATATTTATTTTTTTNHHNNSNSSNSNSNSKSSSSNSNSNGNGNSNNNNRWATATATISTTTMTDYSQNSLQLNAVLTVFPCSQDLLILNPRDLPLSFLVRPPSSRAKDLTKLLRSCHEVVREYSKIPCLPHQPPHTHP